MEIEDGDDMYVPSSSEATSKTKNAKDKKVIAIRAFINFNGERVETKPNSDKVSRFSSSVVGDEAEPLNGNVPLVPRGVLVDSILSQSFLFLLKSSGRRGLVYDGR